jgi:hypothetical protein
VSLRRRLTTAALTVVALLAAPAASHAYLVGVADQNASMFVDPFYTQLIAKQPSSQRISRYIAPYDVANANRRNKAFLNEFINWYRHAQADHVQMLVAFYHSELTPTRMPSSAIYQRDVRALIKRFPAVKAWQPWNEANRGNIKHVLDSPTPSQAAGYYKALRGACGGCTILGLDILDQANVRPTLRYIAQFRSRLRRLHVPSPRLWGLHNYSDTNRFGSSRTRAILAAVPGDVWLTETGGIVKFGGAFPNKKGSGNRRAERALTYMFSLAAKYRRIQRLYIFQWSGASARARFDAGLTDAHGVPRPGYVVVCKHLHAKRCSGFKVDSRN